jgi:hypothetical protein
MDSLFQISWKLATAMRRIDVFPKSAHPQVSALRKASPSRLTIEGSNGRTAPIPRPPVHTTTPSQMHLRLVAAGDDVAERSYFSILLKNPPFIL